MLLADLGADVVRLDRVADVPRTDPGSVSPELLARGRRSIAIDLKAHEGLVVALDLVATADVLIDPYRPGVLERLGLGPDVVCPHNERLVYARMTGWGQTGPLAAAAGHDINYIALTGALAALGPANAPPPVPLNLVGDFGGGGMLLGFGVAAALFERERSGRGQVLDVAMIDGVASLLTSIFQVRAAGDWSDERGANWLQGAAPWYRSYRTLDDRFVSLGPLEPQFYALALERVGLRPEEWPQWDRSVWTPLGVRLEELFATRTMADWQGVLEGTDACFAPALHFDEVMDHPHLAERGTYVKAAGVVQPAPAPRFDRTPGEIAGPPPWPGEHSGEILEELGRTPAESEALFGSGAAARLRVEKTLDPAR
jgi:alpha-methylacyl-CoA racemase